MEIDKIITSCGALAEMIGVMYKSLIGQGISTTDAILLISNILPNLINKPKECEDDNND